MKPQVGQVPATNTLERDAIHIPILRVSAGELLTPGTWVTVKKTESGFVALVAGTANPVGVVDPFITDGYVPKGEKVYIFLKPESTARLWHDWTHRLIDGKNL